MAGFSQGGGVGLALSQWMVHGDPGFDVWAMDVARYGEWATRRYTNEKVRENYARRFSIRFPNEELPAARPQQTTPLYDVMLAEGAVMGDSWGLETPLWFAPKGVEPRDVVSFHRSNDFPHVRAECLGVHEAVGVDRNRELRQIRIHGPRRGGLPRAPDGEQAAARGPHDPDADAECGRQAHRRFHDRARCCRALHDVGLIAGADPSHALVRAPPARRRLGPDTPLRPGAHRARDRRTLLARAAGALTDEDVSNAAFKFMDHRALDVANVPAMVNRVSYTGELGYEIWVPPEYERRLYQEIRAAGRTLGLVLFGMRALLSMRLEKNYPTWYRELRPIYGPFEAGLDRFVDLGKPEFIGRAAACEERKAGGKLRRVSFAIDAIDTDVLGDEPIWHGGKVIGWVTSGGYGHRVNRSLAQGYVPITLAADMSGRAFEIEILGDRRPATILREPPFDPEGSRMRG